MMQRFPDPTLHYSSIPIFQPRHRYLPVKSLISMRFQTSFGMRWRGVNAASEGLAVASTLVEHDPVVVKTLDLSLVLRDPIERFVGFLDTLLDNRLHPHEHGDAPAFRRQFHHFGFVAQKQRALRAPLDLERDERGPQLLAVRATGVVQVVHERED